MNPAPTRAGLLTTPETALPSAASPTRERVATVLARPLFAPTRRPAAGVAAALEGLPRVTGILVDGGRRSVIFATADGGKPVVVAEGGEVAGFRVQTIESGQVTVLGTEGLRVLRPSFDPSPRPSVATPQLPGLTGLPGLPVLGAMPTPPAR